MRGLGNYVSLSLIKFARWNNLPAINIIKSMGIAMHLKMQLN
ncbi:MAG: hypothetical protein PWP45_1367 [Tepidanaerobacteraceae bacterium]|jgi:hypothetical protein|nr:hypothetical protein [Tepidanaerobacteraceae bacterium]